MCFKALLILFILLTTLSLLKQIVFIRPFQILIRISHVLPNNMLFLNAQTLVARLVPSGVIIAQQESHKRLPEVTLEGCVN